MLGVIVTLVSAAVALIVLNNFLVREKPIKRRGYDEWW